MEKVRSISNRSKVFSIKKYSKVFWKKSQENTCDGFCRSKITDRRHEILRLKDIRFSKAFSQNTFGGDCVSKHSKYTSQDDRLSKATGDHTIIGKGQLLTYIKKPNFLQKSSPLNA